jgi:hypothetical protein
MQQVYSLINTEVEDINADRRSQSTPRKRQWIYPSTPNSDDENYPRIAILNDQIDFQEYGSGQYIETVRSAGQVQQIVYGRIAILPVQISVFVKKKQRHQVTLFDGSAKVLQGKMQADFIGDKIAKFLEMYNQTYFIPNNMEIRVTSIGGTYNNNKFSYAKDIQAEIVMMDEWEEDFTDPGYTDGFIQQIDLNVTNY